jgi:hypothetical protein
LRDSTNQIAANRATNAAASKEAQNEFKSREIAIALERLKLDNDKANNKLDPFVKNLYYLRDIGKRTPEQTDEDVDRWVESKVDARSEQEKLLAGVKDLINPPAPGTKTPKPAAPKSRVLAPKGFVYMVDAKGQVGLIREENVEKAMTRGGTIL